MRHTMHRYRNRLSYKRASGSMLGHLGLHVGLPVIIFAVAIIAATGTLFLPTREGVDFHMLMVALGASLLRLLSAYAASLVLAVPLALLAERNKVLESILLPVYDVLESIPILAFFPVIILFFLRFGWLEAAAIVIIVLNMVWNIVFNVVGGMKLIPKDILSAATIFGYGGFSRLRAVLLPALFPSLVTGSILAIAEGWNMLIVAEVLHAYAPQTLSVSDLFGIGSILVSAASSGQTALFLWAAGIIVIAVSVVNLGLWQPLLARSERYKFE